MGSEGTTEPAPAPDRGDSMVETRTRELFAQWRGGDDLAAAGLFELHQAWLADQVARLLGPKLRTKVEPADVVQDIGIRLLRYTPNEQDGALERFRGLLRSMVQHVVTDYHRRLIVAEKRNAGPELQIRSDTGMAADPPRGQHGSPSEAFGRGEDVALARLTFWFVAPERRDVIALRWWYDTPFSELAERFGADEAAMRMRHLRATQEFGRVLAKVRAALAKLPPAEVELLVEESRGAPASGSGVDSRVLARSRVARFAEFLAALKRLAAFIGEPLYPLADGWPRILVPSRADAPPPDRGRAQDR